MSIGLWSAAGLFSQAQLPMLATYAAPIAKPEKFP